MLQVLSAAVADDRLDHAVDVIALAAAELRGGDVVAFAIDRALSREREAACLWLRRNQCASEAVSIEAGEHLR